MLIVIIGAILILCLILAAIIATVATMFNFYIIIQPTGNNSELNLNDLLIKGAFQHDHDLSANQNPLQITAGNIAAGN